MATSNNIYLQLGDIIQIDAPTNSELNQHIFLIDYINNKKIKIIDEDTTKLYTLDITAEGNLSDESIQSISILNRADTTGYARQNNLIPNNWVDIHFGGDLPVTITGQITNLEEDMIEVELLNEKGETADKELIYIDFGYKGIPENIPIDKIVIRNAPDIAKKMVAATAIATDAAIATDDATGLAMDKGIGESKAGEEEELDWEGKEEGEVYEPERYLMETAIQIPVEKVKAQLKDIILEADQIEFGPQLEAITQIVEVPEEQKRYGIETQTNELLDDLLASIPNAQRTRSVLNNIHIMIERFKQLRSKFSSFDQNGNANMPIFKGANYRPLIDKINNMNYKLSWILPVAQNVKKMYDLDIKDDNAVPDVISLTLAQSRINEFDIRELYETNADNYATYMTKIQPSLTPFNTNYNVNALTVNNVLENFDTVIYNLDNFYSSIAKNDTIKRKRFLISRYNLGLSKLQTADTTGGKIKTRTIPMTNNDLISVKSILTLQEPVVYFSNISLPSTNIYDKTNLNSKFLNYWQLFRENTAINTQFIDNLNATVEFDDAKYLKNKTEYLLSDENNDPDKFKKFLEIIIPKTRVLFNLVKKHINGKLSLVSVVNYLQPFLVYLDDISFKQYEEIKEFIELRILDYKKQYASNKEVFSKLGNSRNEFFYESVFYKILKGRSDISDLILKEYGLGQAGSLYQGIIPKESVLTPAEMNKYMNRIDYTRLFHTSMSVLNIDLFTPFNFDDLLEEKKEEYKVELDKKNAENQCAQNVLTKRYISLEDLNADNDIPVYFDKKYDTTVYDIINEYKTEQREMDEATFKNFLIDQLVKNVGLKKPEAKYEATSMIEKKREVQDGHYAVLEVDNIDNVKYYYYKRDKNTWVRDEAIPENSFFGSNELFCNIQSKCIQIDKKCADPALGSDLVKNDLIREMYDEFDANYIESVDKYKQKIDALFKFEMGRISKLKTINKFMLYKYENAKLKLASNVEESDGILSPYIKLLDIILGQGDFVKKQNDIVRFVNKYTRPSLAIKNENEYWLYCIDTDTKLLPTFVSKLASVFVENGNYYDAITAIKCDQGVDIDDKTVDKHSGWEIEKIALNSDEGFEASGFKMISREILEMDAGTALFQGAVTGAGAGAGEKAQVKKDLLANPKGKIVNNVITAISNYMGVVLESQREEIIKHTLLALEETVDTQDEYEAKMTRKLKEGKKMPTYEDVFNKSLLIYALSYISIYISTSIPSISSKKTFPGCKRSLIGYPIKGDEDISNIQYIACVAAGIKTNIYPWKAVPKSAEKIATAMKNTIDAYILKQGDIGMLVDDKRAYLLQNEDDFIPVELDIKNWINFLPPLQEITNKTPANLDTPFRNALLENLKKGSKDQFEQLRVVDSKMISFTMAIIQSIQKVVHKENLLLTNMNKVPFLQNACCNTGEYKTIDYFIKREPSIANNNDIVSNLYNIAFDMVNMAQPTMLVDPNDTKIKFPVVSNEFSEDTIYRGFIEYCNFNSDIPINEKLKAICLAKPDEYDKNDNLKENIRKLKNEGKVYSLATFNELLDSVNKMNIIPLDLAHNHTSALSHIRDLITHMIETNNAIGEDFLNMLKNVLDSFEVENQNENPDVRKLKNMLGDKILVLEESITGYLNSFADITKTEKNNMAKFIKTIMDFNPNGNKYITNTEDETLYRSIQFVKHALYNFIKVFPTIISNRVDYNEIKIPTHWKLSQEHNGDIKNIIKDFYSSLRKFYEDTTILPYLQRNNSDLQDFFKLVNYMNLYSNIVKLDGSELTSILDNTTSYQLFQFFFLYAINNLIQLTDDRKLIAIDVRQPVEEDIITTTVELAEEDMAEVTDIDIIRGEQRSVREKIANVVVVMLNLIRREKDMINLNSKMIREKVNRSKDKERHKITSTLRDMSKQDRAIENLFKNHRLERWNKGLQKGLTQYVAKTYDEERAEREKDQILEQQLENRELLGQAITADRDIAMMEAEEGQIVADRIDADVFNMTNIPDDDDMGDADDEYRLQFDDNEE